MSARQGPSWTRRQRDKAKSARGRRFHALSEVFRDCMLETRTLLSVTTAIRNQTLFVTGDASSDNVRIHALEGQADSVIVVELLDQNGKTIVGIPIQSQGPAGEVFISSIEVDGAAGDFTLSVTPNTVKRTPIQFTGGTGSNTLLQGAAASLNTWTITGTNSGTLTSGTDTPISFSGVQNLASFSLVGPTVETDEFVFTPQGRITGTISSGDSAITLRTPDSTSGTLTIAGNVTSTRTGNITVDAGTIAMAPAVTISTQQGDIGLNAGTILLGANDSILTGLARPFMQNRSGKIAMAGGTIALGPDVTLSTRQTSGADLLDGSSTGNSGDISLTAPSIALGQGDLVLAQVDEGSLLKPGNVVLEAKDTSLGQATLGSPVDPSMLAASISITGTTIRGGDVEIKTEAAVEQLYENWGAYGSKFGDTLFQVLNQIPGLAISALTGISGQVIVRQANAAINLDSSSIEASKAATVASSAIVNSSFHTVTINGLLKDAITPFAISLGYGEANSSATTTLNNTTITSEEGANVTSSVKNEDVAKARSTANLGVPNPNTVALALAVANTSETSHVSVLGKSSVTSKKGGVNTDATGDVTNFAWAEPTVFQEGQGAFAIAIDYDTASIRTQVDGNLDAGGASNTFNTDPAQGPVAVDYTGDTITIPNHGFEDGKAVIYSNGGGTDIGGLKDGQTYYAQVVDANAIQLANAPSLPLTYSTPSQYTTGTPAHPNQTLGRLAKLDFDPSAVDTKAGTITFSSPPGLTDGQPVTYYGTTDVQGGGQANRGVAPLVQGRTYYVKLVNNTTIRLSATPGGAAIVLTNSGVGTHSLLAENHTASFDPGVAVSNESNTITFTSPHGFQTGDAVVYHTDPTLTLTGSLGGMAAEVKDPAIGELEDGNLYFVVVVDNKTIRLTGSKQAAFDALPIDLTPATVLTGNGLGSKQSVGAINGIVVHAGLNAVNVLTSSTRLSEDAFNAANFLVQAPAGSAETLIGAIAKLPESLVGDIFAEDPLASSLPILNVGFAGAIGINYFLHDVEAIVGPAAKLASSSSLKVAAEITEAAQNYVTAEGSKEVGTELVVSAAVGIGIFNNTAKATVMPGAELDADDDLAVVSDVNYPFLISNPLSAINPADYLKTTGPDGWIFFNDGTLGLASNLFNTFVTSQSSVPTGIAVGGSFALNNYTNDSEATIGSGARINEDPAPRFHEADQTVAVEANTELNLIHVLGVGGLSFSLEGLFEGGKTIKEDLSIGLGTRGTVLDGVKSLVNPFGAEGGPGGIGASVSIQNIKENTVASIGTDAKVTAAGTTRPGLVFDPMTPGVVAGDVITFPITTERSMGDAVVYDVGPGGRAVGGLKDGATYYVIPVPGNSKQFRLAASREDAVNGVSIPLDPSKAAGSDQRFGDSNISVNAATRAFDFAFGFAGASASSFGLSGAVTAGVVDNTTLAHVDPGAFIASTSAIGVSAIDESTQIDITGGVTSAVSVGVGASIGLNLIHRNTQAYIGAGIDPNTGLALAPGSKPTDVFAQGPVTVNASTDGGLWTVSLAAAVAESQVANAPTQKQIDNKVFEQNTPTKAGKLLGFQKDESILLPITQAGALALFFADSKDNKPQITVAAAGDVSINILNGENTFAFINDPGHIVAQGAPVTVRSEDQTTVSSLAGAVALSLNASTQKPSLGLAGSISVNVMQGDTRAFIQSATVSADALNVEAARGGSIRSLTAGGSGAPAQTGVAVAGSFSVNVVLESVKSYLSDANLTLASDSSVTAVDSSDIWAIAGAFAYGGSVGLGLAIGVNLLGDSGAPNQTLATISDSTITIDDGTLLVQATNANPTTDAFGNSTDPRIIAFTGAGGANKSTNGFTGAGMVSVNVIDTAVGASVVRSTVTEPTPKSGTASLAVEAVDSSGIISVGGAVTIGQGAGLGAAIGYNQIDGSTTAVIDSSTVNVSGGVSVTALSQANILGIAVGVAVGLGKQSIAAAGSASINLIHDVVQALIVSAANPAMMTSILAGGPILVEAADSSSIVGASGGIGVAVGGVAVGIAVTYNLIQNTISADAENSRVKSKAGAITFDADSSPAIIAIAAGLSASGSGSIAGAGSIAINSIAGNVDAHVSANSDVETPGDITIVAAQSAPMVAVSGGVAVGAGSVLAGAFGYNFIGAGGNSLDANAINNPSTPGGSLSFNPTGSAVDPSAHTITFADPYDGFLNGQAVTYRNLKPGRTGLNVAGGSPLQDGATYYVIVISPNTIQLASSRANALAGIALPITNAGTTSAANSLTTVGNSVTAFIDKSTVISSAGSISIDGGLVKPGTVLATQVPSDAPLSARPVATVKTLTVNPTTAVNASNHTIALTSVAGLVDGSPVVYHNNGGNPIAVGTNDSLKDGATYYVVLVPNTSMIKLDSSQSDARSASPQKILPLVLSNSQVTTSGTAHTFTFTQVNALTGQQNLTLPLPVDLDTQLISVTVSGGLSLGDGIAVAGSLSLNFIRNSVDVGIHNIGSSQSVSAQKTLSIDAADASKIIAIAGGASVTFGTAGIGGALAYDDIQNTVTARIGSALAPTSTDPTAVAATDGNLGPITSFATAVSSTVAGSIVNVTFDLSAATDVALGAAVSINKIADTADAHVAHSGIGQGTKGLSITAANTSNINATAGSGAGSGSVAAGAGVGYNDISDTVLAFADAVSTAIVGNVTLAANSSATIQSISLGIAVAGDAALAGSGAGNLISNLVEAFITDNSQITASGNVTVSADSDNSNSAFGGSLGVGVYFGAGGAVAVNLLTNTTRAYINGGSQVGALGLGAGSPVETWGTVAGGRPAGSAATGKSATELDRGIAVTASTTEVLNNITAAAGGGVVGIAFDVLVNIVEDTTDATIDRATVLANGTGSVVIVRSHQDTEDMNSGGSLAVGGGAGAAGVNVDIIKNDTEALVTNTQPLGAVTTTVSANQGVEVSSLTRTNAVTTAVGVAIGGVSVAGSASGLNSASTNLAAIANALVTTIAGPINVAANDAVNLRFNDGAGAVGGIAGIGGAVAVGIVNDTTSATIQNAQTTSASNTNVEADSAETLSTQAGTASIATIFGIGGTVAVLSLSPTTSAFVDANSNVQARGSLNVKANDVLNLPGDVVGTATVGGLIGAGFSVEVITVHDTVDAHIANSTAAGDQGVTVGATGQRTFASTIVAFGGGGGIGINGAVSVLSLGADLDPTSSGQVAPSQNSANNSLLHSQGVSGLNTTDNSSIAPSGSIGAALQSGANANLFTVSLASGTSTIGATQAYLGDGALVSSTAGGITVSATETVTIDDKIGGGALGLVAAAGASVGIANINSKTTAYIAGSAQVSATGDIAVTSTFTDNVGVHSYGAQGSIGIALGAVYAAINDNSTQTAYVSGGVTQAHNLSITAQGPNHTLLADDFGFVGGIAAAGATIGTAANTGSTRAYLDAGAVVGSITGGLSVNATSGTLATTNMLITSAAGVGVRVNKATATITPTIDARIGGNPHVIANGNVTVNATSTLAEGHADARSYGGALVDIGAGVAIVTVSPVVKGSVDVGAHIFTRGDIRITSTGGAPAPAAPVPGSFNPSKTVDTGADTVKFPINLTDGSEVQYQAGNPGTPVGGLHTNQLTLTVSFQPSSGAGDVIVRTDGKDWAADGLTPGVTFGLQDKNDPTDNGQFTVSAVKGNRLFVTVSNLLNSASNQTAILSLNRVYRVMNPSLMANNLQFANSNTGNTITRSLGSWLTDGFQAGGQITVGGNNNRGTYTLQSVTDLTLTVVNNQNAPWAEPGTLANATTVVTQGAFRFGQTFDASRVDPATDSITFAAPHDFQTGDAVRFDTGGNTPLGSIDPSKTYYVRKVDDHTIQLSATLADAVSPPSQQVSPSSYDVASGAFNLATLASGLSPFRSILVTYHAPVPATFYIPALNVTYDDQGNQSAKPNTIYTAANALRNDEVVTYSFTGTVSPIVGLSKGQQFGVTIASTDAKAGTSNVQLYALNDPKKTPITLTASTDPAARSSTMSLTGRGFGPLVAQGNGESYTFVDGGTYLASPFVGKAGFYRISDPVTGVVFTAFNTNPTVWDPAAVQTFTGGLIPIYPTSGTQSLYIDLSSAPNQTDFLTAAGGASLSTLAPAGSGISTATVEGGGFGLVGQFAFPTSQLVAAPVVWAYSSAATLQAGGDVVIAASSTSNVTATIDNGGGGLLSVGQVSATVTQNADTEAFLGHSGSPKDQFIDATNEAITGANVSITSTSDLTSYVSARSTAGGGIGGAIAHTSDRVDETTFAQVGSGGKITATGALVVAADSKKSAHTNAYSFVVAIGGGANSDQQSFDTPSGVNVGTSSTPSETRVFIGDESILKGRTVSLKATNSKSDLQSDANATAISPILLGVDVALATVNVYNYAATTVTIEPQAAITGTNGVDVLSILTPAKVTTNLSAVAVAIIPVPISSSNTPKPTDTPSTVFAGPGATVSAGIRAVADPIQQLSVDTSGNAVKNIALNVQAYQVSRTGGKSGGTITWSADVNVLGGMPTAATLTIDALGKVTQNVGFTLATAGGGQTASLPISQGGAIYFFGEEKLLNENVPTFTFASGIPTSITVHDSSLTPLTVSSIDVTGLTTRPEVYLDSTNQGIPPVTKGSAFNFDIARTGGQATLVDIEDDNPTGPTLAVGNINNPVGQTIVKNLHGPISFGGSTITTNQLQVVAGAGDVGTVALPLHTVMVQYKNDAGLTMQPLLNVTAAGSIALDILGRQRDGVASDPVVINSAGIIAGSGPGNNIVISEEQGLQDGVPTTKGGVLVSATQQTPADSTQTAPYHAHYFPENGPAITNTDLALNADTSNPSKVRTAYNFLGFDSTGTQVNPDGLIAGGNLLITPGPSANLPTVDVNARLNLNPIATSTGRASVDANGTIYLLETVGALRVGTINSRDTAANDPRNIATTVVLAAFSMTGVMTGLDIDLQDASATITAQRGVSLTVQNDFNMALGSTITTPTSVSVLSDDFGDQSHLVAGKGSKIRIAGKILSPIDKINQSATLVPLNDNISLTNVQAGTTATITTVAGQNIISLGSLFNLATLTPYNGGQLATIAGPTTVNGSGADTLNLDDTGDTTAWPASNFPTITSTRVTGLGAVASGIVYAKLSALNLKLGTKAQTVDVKSTAAGTTTTVRTQVAGNIWNVGSLAPTITGGVLAGVQGPLILDGGGVNTALADTLNVDDSGSTLANETGTLTESTITGLGMGAGGVTYAGMAVLQMTLGDNATTLSGFVHANANLPATTLIRGGVSKTDSFLGNWSGDFNGSLTLQSLADSTTYSAKIQGVQLFVGAGSFNGSLLSDSVAKPGEIRDLVVFGSVTPGASITAGSIQALQIDGVLGINLTLPGTFSNVPALNSGRIGSLPAGITLKAREVTALTVGYLSKFSANDHNLSGNVVTTLGNLGTLTEELGSITPTATVTVARDLGSLTVGPAQVSVGQNMAGLIDVAGTLGTARIAGGTPGLFRARSVGTIGTYGGFGPVVLHVVEAGVDRRVEEAAPGQFYLQPSASNIAGSPYINIQDLYESAGFSSPQLSAQIAGNAGLASRRFDLSTVVLQDGAKFNVARLDATGVSGLRNLAVEGDLVPGVSPSANGFFVGDTAPAGIYLPLDNIAGIGIRDAAVNGSIKAAGIQGVAFGSFTNTGGQVMPGTKATNLDAANLLAAGTRIVAAGSVGGQGTETFRVPFAALPGQQVAFFLDTAPGGGLFDPKEIDFTVQSNSDGVNTPQVFPATRGAVTALIGATAGQGGATVQTVDLYGDGGSILSDQFIAGSINSTGPLGDVVVLAPQGLNNLTAPSLFGNVAASGPLFGTIQTTGVRTDPISGAPSQVSADMGRAFVVQPIGRNAQKYVTATTIGGQGADSLMGSIISRGNLISSIRSDGGATGHIATQGNLGASTTLLGTPTRVGGFLVNGGYSGRLVVMGDAIGDLTFHGGLTGGRIAVKGTAGDHSGIVGNLVIDRGFYPTGLIDPNSSIISGGEIGDSTLGTTLSVADGNTGIVAADGSINLGKATLGGHVFKNARGTANAAAIDALFTKSGQALGLDLPNSPLGGLELILEALAELHYDPTDGKLK